MDYDRNKMRASEISLLQLRTVTIARDIAEDEAATAYDALSEKILELRDEVDALRREVRELRLAMLGELERLREDLG